MSEQEVESRVKEIIATQLGIEVDEIVSDASFVEDMGADSLDIVELIMAMEEEFALEISDDEAEKLVTVQDTINYVERKIQ